MIDDNQWVKYETKYGRLMHKISRSISGDEVIAAVEDNYGDLCIAALDSIKGFTKKTGLSFDEMFGTKLFDQYTKTCLWHVKGNKGSKITKKYPITKHKVSLYDHPEVFSLSGEDTNSVDAEEFLTALSSGFTQLEKNVVSTIVQNPDCIGKEGRIIFSRISHHIGHSTYLVKKALSSLENKLRLTL